MKSPIMALYLEPFKTAAAEGAEVELKLRLQAGTVPFLARYAHQDRLQDIEDDLVKLFGDALSADEKETLRLCRQLRNKVLHTDFRAARDKLKELGANPTSGGVVRIELPEPTIAEATKKIAAAKEGKEGLRISDTCSTEAGSVFGWFMEAGGAGAFKKAAAIVDRLATEQALAAIQKAQQKN